MKTVGFPISTKENEKRRALFPSHIHSIKHRNLLYFQTGYGQHFGYDDKDYVTAGANICKLEEILTKDIICDPKIGDATYLPLLRKGQIIFGWVHAVQNRHITEQITQKGLTAIAWEDMFEEGRHVFWRSNELAGEAAIMHAFTLYGKLAGECRVALLGRGNVARGAHRILSCLGATVTVYDRKSEQLLSKELESFDVIVNAVLWDVYRTDHIIYRTHLKKIKKPGMIIDISCDRRGGVETCIPTTIENPTYYVDGVLHYAVDHTPAILGYSVTDSLGKELIKYIDVFIEGNESASNALNQATCIMAGRVLDERITEFQKRKRITEEI